MINVRHLGVFRAVMRAGSVSAAARMLHVSQPAVTKTLQEIETRLGVPLFERVRGRLRATQEAGLLLPKVERVFGAVEEVERLAEEIGGGDAGRIVVATVSTLGASVTGPAIARYRGRHPNVAVQVSALSTRRVVEEVDNNQVDLGILDTGVLAGPLQSRPLCRGSLGCVLPRDHALARRSRISARNLRGETIIAFREETNVGLLVRQQISRSGVPLSIAITTNQSLLACTMVRERVGIALIDPFTVLSGLFPDLVVLPWEPRVEIGPQIVFPPKRPLSLVAREFVTELEATVADLVPRSALLGP